MSTLIEKAKALGNDETLRGLAPSLLFVFALILLNQRYDYIRTSLTKTVEGFETQTMYLRQIGADFCIGDMVKFRSVERRARFSSFKYYRKVIAGGDTVLTLTGTGYRIGDTDFPMSADWSVKARKTNDGQTELTVPPDYFLFVNPDFKAGDKYNDWALETVPRDNVIERVSHIMLSRDFSRIGEKVGTTDPTCVR
jgi:hypothetical protein